jgi:hypothetical protein
MIGYLGYWIAYTATGVAVLVHTQRGRNQPGAWHTPSADGWFMETGGSILIVLGWPLIVLLLLWVSFQQWRRYRP